MNVNTLSENEIKICLTEDEIDRLFGGYDMIDYQKPQARMVLNSLLSDVLREESLTLDCKQIIIEVRPIRGGCAIHFKKVSKNEKRYKKVRRLKGFLVLLYNADSLLSLKEDIEKNHKNKITKAGLLKYGKTFILHIVTDSSFLKDVSHLEEYGRVIEEKSVRGAHILEYSKTVCKNILK